MRVPKKKVPRKQKKQNRGYHAALRYVLAVLLLIGGLLLVQGLSGAPSDEDDAPSSVGGIPIHTQFLDARCPARPGIRRRIQWVVIHETANTGADATAKAHADYLLKNSWTEEKSWHYTVDDTEIWHHLPDREVGYHAGDRRRSGGGNRNGIGIELCVNAGGDFDKTMENAAVLTAYLLEKYDLELEDVKIHRNFSGKLCPETILRNGRWEEFLALVERAEEEHDFSSELSE